MSNRRPPVDQPAATAAGAGEMGEYGLIQSLPDEVRVALNTLIDTRTEFISAQFGNDERKTDRAYEAYHRADRACRVLIAKHLLARQA